ncbi:MAG: pentapeptide repeat-containing protein, partial [Chamaesiphon sp.]|nr:pentapeptide repeat-containing protein [Chamaesiphon sp.]
ADLTDARMHHADLTRTILCYSTMINVESIEAHLAKTDLEDANLTNANLMRAEMSSASTIGTILTGAKMPDGRMYANV